MQTQTVQSLGKLPYRQLRQYSKRDQYYAKRNIVRQKNLGETQPDILDQKSQKIPTAPSIPKREAYTSYYSDPKISMQGSNANSKNFEAKNDFETLYYKEQAKNQGLIDDINNLSETNQKLQDNKELMKNNYEEFISKLEAEINQLKQFEVDYNNLDAEKRSLEEEIRRVQLELSLLKKNSNVQDEGLTESLREKIRTLNQEKMELLNDLEFHKGEVHNLKTQINYFNEEKPEPQDDTQLLRDLADANDRIRDLEQDLMKKDQLIINLQKEDDKDKRINYLEEKIKSLGKGLEESKRDQKCRDCDSKTITINHLNERIAELLAENKSQNYPTTTIVHTPPRVVERVEVRPSITYQSPYTRSIPQSYSTTIKEYTRSPRVSEIRTSSPVVTRIDNTPSYNSYYKTYTNTPTSTNYLNPRVTTRYSTTRYEPNKYSSYNTPTTRISTHNTRYPSSYKRYNEIKSSPHSSQSNIKINGESNIYASKGITVYTDKPINVYSKNDQNPKAQDHKKNSEYF